MARKHQLTRIVLAGIAAALAGTAAAQTTGGLEEIIVTAQKCEQSMQDVGIAVTAFSDRQIREYGFTDSTDVVAMTPGLIYTTPNAESSVINFFLRGVGLNDFADANENPVAVYVDDVYRPASGGLSFQLFDLQRVEVLRGPQGTLFGRNTTGGLVHFISKRPTDELASAFYISLRAHDRPGVLAAVAGVFGAHGVSIASMEQEGPSPDPTIAPADGEARLDFVTHTATERDVHATLDSLRSLDGVRRVGSVVRVLGEDAGAVAVDPRP